MNVVNRAWIKYAEYTLPASTVDERRMGDLKRHLPYVIAVWQFEETWFVRVDMDEALRRAPLMQSRNGHLDTWAMKMEHIRTQIWLNSRKEQ